MKQEVDTFKLYENWFENVATNINIKSIHSHLYSYIINTNNILFWKPQFFLPTEKTMQNLNILSYKTYINALLDLEKFGVIKIISRAKNQNTSNIIELVKNTKANTKAIVKASTQSDDQSNDSIIKLLNIETIKLINNNISLVNENLGKWIENHNKPKKPKKEIDPFLIDIKTPPQNINKEYFYLAKYFHKVFINFHGELKSLQQWKLNETINDIRKLVEIDLQPVRRLFAFSHFLENDKSNFWIKNTFSLKNLRKQKDNIYKYDQLTTQIEVFYEKNINIRDDFDIRYNNFLKLVQ